jgi:hypothetical protein
MADLYEPRPMDQGLLEPVSVRCVVAFGLGDKVVQVGELLTVSRARAEYLRFLCLVEWV